MFLTTNLVINVVILFSLTNGFVTELKAPIRNELLVNSMFQKIGDSFNKDSEPAGTHLHDYNAEDEDTVGYIKNFEDGNSDGYSHFDSYHTKDGDKYGYEKHTAFGAANNADYGTTSNEKNDEDNKGQYEVNEEINEEGDHENLEENIDDHENVENQHESTFDGAESGEQEHLEDYVDKENLEAESESVEY